MVQNHNKASEFFNLKDYIHFRTKDRCSKANCTEDVLIRSSHPVTSIALNPLVPYHLAAGSGDGCVRIYDRRMLGTRRGNVVLKNGRHKLSNRELKF